MPGLVAGLALELAIGWFMRSYLSAEDLALLRLPDLKVIQRVFLALPFQVGSDVLSVLVELLRLAVPHTVVVQEQRIERSSGRRSQQRGSQ